VPSRVHQSVLRRKKLVPTVRPEHISDKDPATQAALVAESWGASIQAIIKTGVLIAESLRAFDGDPDRLDAFIIALVEKGVLTPNEARRRHVAPKLVELRTIGEHEKLFTLPQVVPFLVPSYTTLYHLTVLFRQLPETDEQKQIANLIKKLESAPDKITRDFLIDETALLKRGRRKAALVASAPDAAQFTNHGFASQAQPQLVLITPDLADERAVATAYATSDGLEQRLPITNQLRESDELAVVLVTRVSALPLIAEKLLNLCGFDCHHARFFLPQPPNAAEVGDEVVAVTADRGDVHIMAPPAGAWLDPADAADPRAIAARLYPEVATRLHVFAKSRAKGWQALVGAENWAGE
jgi:hypothetical protein